MEKIGPQVHRHRWNRSRDVFTTHYLQDYCLCSTITAVIVIHEGLVAFSQYSYDVCKSGSQLHFQSWKHFIRYKRMRWLGHLSRMDHQMIPRQAVQREPEGFRRRPGRPRQNWNKLIQKKNSGKWTSAGTTLQRLRRTGGAGGIVSPNASLTRDEPGIRSASPDSPSMNECPLFWSLDLPAWVNKHRCPIPGFKLCVLTANVKHLNWVRKNTERTVPRMSTIYSILVCTNTQNVLKVSTKYRRREVSTENAQFDLFRTSCSEGHCLNHLYTANSKPAGAMQLKHREHNFLLPVMTLEFKKKTFNCARIVRIYLRLLLTWRRRRRRF